ncbi:MAG: hypothetical protein JO362_13205 [Streptomycetaceae bacterium]|nr:hypothetical protein [Streptomycetaceae bacterium]
MEPNPRRCTPWGVRPYSGWCTAPLRGLLHSSAVRGLGVRLRRSSAVRRLAAEPVVGEAQRLLRQVPQMTVAATVLRPSVRLALGAATAEWAAVSLLVHAVMRTMGWGGDEPPLPG